MSAEVRPPQAAAPCAHCGEPVPPRRRRSEGDSFCCAGCEAVRAALTEAGLLDYYRLRDALPGPAGGPRALPDHLEDPEWTARYVRGEPEGGSLRLAVDGIHCSSCGWVIDAVCRRVDGVRDVRVLLTEERAILTLSPDAAAAPPVAALLRELSAVGYGARPLAARGDDERDAERHRARDELLRLGTAGAIAMNLMLAAVAMYGGDAYGMAEEHRSVFRWVSLVLATPLVAYSAAPILRRAVSSLRLGRVHVDQPLALAILALFTAGAHATWTGGEVWFDSLGMLVFLILAGRWVESALRRRTGARLAALLDESPAVARRLDAEGRPRPVDASLLRAGDRVELLTGDLVPADVVVDEGAAEVERSVLTGEPEPVPVAVGDPLEAGAAVVAGRLLARVLRAAEDGTVGRLRRDVEAAAAAKTPPVVLADRVARWFVGAVLVIAAATAAAWWQVAPERALPATVAVLAAACPCALALATPLAFAAGVYGAGARGLRVRDGGVLWKLADVGRVAFDKTGTLTRGRLEPGALLLTEAGSALGRREVLERVGVLACASRHPVSRAVVEAARAAGCSLDGAPTQVVEEVGRGLRGVVSGVPVEIARPGATLRIDGRLVGTLGLRDVPRDTTPEALAALREQGVEVTVLSGDASARTASFARRAGIADALGACSPEDKAAHLRACKEAGESVLFVGDGLNDGPALAVADVGIAVAGGTDLAVQAADGALLGGDPRAVAAGIRLGRRMRRILVQNLAGSLLYNALAVTAAAFGFVTPLVAAVLMPISSVAVLLNAARLTRPPAPSERSRGGSWA